MMKPFLVIPSLLLFLAPVVQGECPSNANLLQTAINDCTAPIGRIDYYSNDLLGFCNNSAQGVVDCIQTLLTDCQAVSQSAVIALLGVVDVDNLVNSIELVCNSTSIIEAEAVCIDEQRDTSRSCVFSEYQEYSVQLSLIAGQLFQKGVAWYQAEFRKAACGYTRSLGGCSSSYLTNCNTDVHSIYKALFTSISLPACETVLGPEGPTTPDPGDGCPRNPAQTVIDRNQCINPFRPLANYRNGLPSVDRLLAFCNNTEPHLTSCLSHLQTCAGKYSVVQDQLSGSLNVAELLNFNNRACQDANFLNNMKACVSRLESAANTCASTENIDHARAIATAQQEAVIRGTAWYRERTLRLGCTYIDNLKKCVKPYETSCGADISEMYISLFDAVAAPACANLPPETTTTSTTTTTTAPPAFGIDGGFA